MEVIEVSEVFMVYVIYQVTESLTNYFDTYFSILVMNTIFFSSSKRKKNIGQNNRFSG